MTNRPAKVFVRTPSAALRLFVKHFLVVEFPLAIRDWHLPATGLIAAFPFSGHCQLEDGRHAPRACLTGLWSRVRHHVHSKNNSVVIVAFNAIGASAFVRNPLDELADATVALDGLIGDTRSLGLLEEQLAEAPNHFRRTQLVENFLLTRLGPRDPDSLVTAAVSWIERASPGARIETLVRHIGLSQSALERRFRRVVGATPKQFATLVRLERVLLLREAGENLTSIAHAAGYFDQPHFVHDFKRITGLSPEAYFAKTTSR